jgi:hypothetical protein
VDNEDEGARLTRREENRELIAKHRATVEPRGCPTPGACSCPGTTPFEIRKKIMTAHMLAESIVERATVETPRTDGIVFKAQPGMMPPYDTVPAEFSRTLERELIDLKQRLLPQYKGRAERAEDACNGLRKELMEVQKVISEMIAGVSTWADAWRESK